MTVDEAKNSLNLYLHERVHPGSFLTAVLCNDLQRAIAHADPGAEAVLGEIVRHICSSFPGYAHGSPRLVEAWLNRLEVLH